MSLLKSSSKDSSNKIHGGKVDPSFKSKRYRDKLRTEIKELESLIPLDRSTLHRKLDSQTVFRLVIAFFRTKTLFKGLNCTTWKLFCEGNESCGSLRELQCLYETKALGVPDENVSPSESTKTSNDDDSIDEEVENLDNVCKNSTGTDEKYLTNETEDQKVGVYLSSSNLLPILDGFLLVASTDGTILYVSDNVLQYLGFNQVDLMHRCIYGIVHPDDHLEIKKALEGKTDRSDNKQCLFSAQDGLYITVSITDGGRTWESFCKNHKPTGSNWLSFSCTHTGSARDLKPCGQEKKACSKVDTTEKQSTNEISPISFLCRMKCFSGNTAGFMKLHCSGKIRHIPELGKANRISPDVAIIYCQPFMLTGNDFTHEIKQDVFWSKHDMDLTIRELDKKSLEMIGYETDELNGKSLYSIIHPEDLFTCAACHKTLTESMEIQTMYLRLQTKGGTWMWFHTRGKVICKNSKKFSIVFTHCPVREEDSTFIQQESALRQRYAITDLIYMHQFGLRANSAIFYSDMTDHGEPLSSHRSSQCSLDDEIALVLQGSMSNCPSSWHATLERHSPVLPSSHVAHKITQREKQIQYAEFKRRKQNEQTIQQNQSWNHTTFSNNTAPSQVSFCLPEISFPTIPQMQTQPDLSTHSQFGVTNNAYGDNRQFWFSYYGPPTNIHDRDIKHPPWHHQNIRGTYQADCGNYFNPTLVRTPVYNFPPSPPPSPDIHHRRGYERKSSIWAEDPAGSIYHGKNRDVSANSPIKCPTVNYQMPIVDVKANLFSPYEQEAARTIECMGTVQHIQSQANIRFSMRYHTCLGNREGIEQGHQFVNPINPPVMPQINQTLGLSANNIISIPYADNETETNSINDVKPVLTSSQSCAFASGCCVEPKEVQYDIEASIHMKIVENERKAMTAGKEVLDLPSIGSFLEYLNEG